MKRIATITILAVMAMVAASSCTKELNGAVDKAEGTVSFTVRAELPDYDADTKNTLVNTVRVKWENGDDVYVYDNQKCLGILKANDTDDEGKVTYLSGDIDASEASYLTLAAMSDDIKPSVFTKGSAFTDGITFDLSKQGLSGAPYVAYATVLNNGTSGIGATFKFATSVVRVNCTGLKASTDIDSVIIQGVNTQLKITPSTSGDPTVAAEEGKGTIIRKQDIGLSYVNAEGTTTFSAALLAQDASARRINVIQGNCVTEAKFTGGSALSGGMSYNTVCQLSSDYVLIKAKYNGTDSTTLKWYKQNLAITASGKKAWKGTNTSAVKVPGTNGEEVIVGDYFQWAASYAGYDITDEGKKKPENLLVYTAFINKGCGESEDGFTSIDSKQFNQANAPYGGASYTKYNDDDKDTKSILDTTSTSNDDVAHIILGGKWRMPTSAEFKAMKDATYWAWDDTDQGYYVFWPGQGTNGTAGERAVIADTDKKAAALLFFPAAGLGLYTSLYNAGSGGYYRSSSLYTDGTDDAYGLFFSSDNVYPQHNFGRYFGFSVRPVSD